MAITSKNLELSHSASRLNPLHSKDNIELGKVSAELISLTLHHGRNKLSVFLTERERKQLVKLLQEI